MKKLLNDLIDESVRTVARKPIMLQFDSSGTFLWRQWTGTVVSVTWVSCVRNMVYVTAVFFLFRLMPQLLKGNLQGSRHCFARL